MVIACPKRRNSLRGLPSAACPLRLDFLRKIDEEPHAVRKQAILLKHPEIKELMRPEWRTKWMVLCTVALQVIMAAHAASWPLDVYACAVYAIGATANHSLFLAIHELSHNLGFRSTFWNRMLAVFANTAIGVPYCIVFKPFHMLHHRDMGSRDNDTDIPTEYEAQCISDSSRGRLEHILRKSVFMISQIFAYALRPVLVKPELVVVTRWLVFNWTVQLGFNALVVCVLGWSAMGYLLLSSFLAGSIHPTAGHFISEHYMLEGNKSSETTSYYGALNYVTYNVGYHNEHHDFPNIPWSGLPKVRAIAPEFYDTLPQCKSWSGAIATYILDDAVGPYSRVVRRTTEE